MLYGPLPGQGSNSAERPGLPDKAPTEPQDAARSDVIYPCALPDCLVLG